MRDSQNRYLIGALEIFAYRLAMSDMRPCSTL